jgi:hypothetical protein
MIKKIVYNDEEKDEGNNAAVYNKSLKKKDRK